MFIYIVISSKGYDALGLHHHRCINEHIGSAFLGQVMDERPELTISNTLFCCALGPTCCFK
jgi:hypothetical protein